MRKRTSPLGETCSFEGGAAGPIASSEVMARRGSQLGDAATTGAGTGGGAAGAGCGAGAGSGRAQLAQASTNASQRAITFAI
jgi:hypothetical protein